MLITEEYVDWMVRGPSSTLSSNFEGKGSLDQLLKRRSGPGLLRPSERPLLVPGTRPGWASRSPRCHGRRGSTFGT